MKQVYLTLHRVLANVLDEDARFIAAQSPDGYITYVIKDGQERTRNKEN